MLENFVVFEANRLTMFQGFCRCGECVAAVSPTTLNEQVMGGRYHNDPVFRLLCRQGQKVTEGDVLAKLLASADRAMFV